MEKAKHSPAPWKNGRDANGDVVICQADYTVGPERDEEYQANRALFDAAPELLEALKDCRESLLQTYKANPEGVLIQVVDRAIVKAEGR